MAAALERTFRYWLGEDHRRQVGLPPAAAAAAVVAVVHFSGRLFPPPLLLPAEWARFGMSPDDVRTVVEALPLLLALAVDWFLGGDSPDWATVRQGRGGMLHTFESSQTPGAVAAKLLGRAPVKLEERPSALLRESGEHVPPLPARTCAGGGWEELAAAVPAQPPSFRRSAHFARTWLVGDAEFVPTEARENRVLMSRVVAGAGGSAGKKPRSVLELPIKVEVGNQTRTLLSESSFWFTKL